jgi:hypothetical protein
LLVLEGNKPKYIKRIAKISLTRGGSRGRGGGPLKLKKRRFFGVKS